MATLSGNKIKNTYQSLVKFSDNGNITVSAKQLTDGFGNNSPLYVSTTQVGIGVTPESGLNLHVFGDAKIGSNLTVIGNLVVEGSTTTVGTDTLTVKDPLIVLANNNTSTDAVDIGFYGKYHPSDTTLYSGLFREALTGKYRLFKGLEVEPTTTVNTSGTGYAVASLVANLEGNVTGNLTGNVTGNITGNVTGGTISGTTGTFSGDVNVNSNFIVTTGTPTSADPNGSHVIAKIDSSAGSDTGGLEIHTGDDNGDEPALLHTNYNGDEAFRISSLGHIISTGSASFVGQVTIPETPTADTHAASKGYVDAAVEGQDTLEEILANGNTTGGTDLAVSAGDDITFTDTSKSIYGTDGELEIHHNGSNSYITEDGTGALYLQGTYMYLTKSDGSQKYIELDLDGATDSRVKLNYGGANVLTTTSTGITVSGIISGLTDPSAAQDAATKAYVDTQVSANNELSEVIANGNTSGANDIIMADDQKINFGDDSDLQIYSDGTTGFIKGNLDDIRLTNSDDDTIIKVNSNTAELYHNNVKKLSTTTSNGTGVLIERGISINDVNEDLRGIITGDTDGLRLRGSGGSSFSTQGFLLKNNEYFFEGSWGGGVTGDVLYMDAFFPLVRIGDSTNFDNGNLTDLTVYGDVDLKNDLNVAGNSTFSGNIGIGTTSPDYKLEISDSSATPTILLGQTPYTTNGTFLIEGNQLTSNTDNNDVSTVSVGASRYIVRNGSHRWYSSPGTVAGNARTFTERMRIDSNGNVSIANDTPLYLYSEQDIGQIAVNRVPSTGVITDTSRSAAYINLNASNGGSSLTFHTANANNTAPTERMRITSGGNVGIGTTSPSEKLQINGGYIKIVDNAYDEYFLSKTRTDGSQLVGFQSHSVGALSIHANGSERMRIDSSGNTTFSGMITVNGGGIDIDNDDDVRLRFDNAGTFKAGLQVATTAGDMIAGSAVNDFAIRSQENMLFSTGGNTERMRIDSSGNVNIYGTDNRPLAITSFNTVSTGAGWDLDATSSNGVVTMSTAGTERMRIDSSGNITQTASGNPQFTISGSDGAYTSILQINAAGGGSSKIIASGGSNNLSFETAGSERMRIDSSGNVGIGTTSPQRLLHLRSTNQATGIFLERSNNYGFVQYNEVVGSVETYHLGFVNNNSFSSDILVANELGRVGIGTTSPDAKLDVRSNATGQGIDQLVNIGLDVNWNLKIQQNWNADGIQYDVLQKSGVGAADNVLTFKSGNVGIGTTSPSAKLDVNGDVFINSNYTANVAAQDLTIGKTTTGNHGLTIVTGPTYTGSIYFGDSDNNDAGIIKYQHSDNSMQFVTNRSEAMRITSGGDLHVDGDVVAYSTTISDKRLKDNVKPLESSLDKVMNLKGVEYVWNNGSRKGQKDIGFIAQEVEEVIPEIVREKQVIFNEEEKYKTVDYEKITAVLVEAVKELKAEVEELKKQIK